MRVDYKQTFQKHGEKDDGESIGKRSTKMRNISQSKNTDG